MSTSPHSDFEVQRDELQEKVYSLLSEVSSEEAAELEELRHPLDPDLASTLDHLFQQTSTGREQAQLVELDMLRRAARCDQTEQIFRPYGVLEIVTPVRRKGKTCFVLRSGPLLVEAWNDVARKTLAKLTGLKPEKIPETLSSTSLYTPDQIRAITQLQNRLAARIAKGSPQAATESPNSGTSYPSGTLEMLQPGLLEHLDLLYQRIQQATFGETVEPAEIRRIHKIAERGRTLTDQACRLRNQASADPALLSVHTVLTTWCSKIEEQLPHVRIRTRLEADQDMLTAQPENLHHLIYTLLCGIADGLPEGRALLGVSTQNRTIDGNAVLHVEIRDGGGLETFAGVGGETDTLLNIEQNQVADDTSEWTSLASKCDATIRILRDADTVTRAEIFFPLSPTQSSEPGEPGGHVLWIVEDNDREVEHLMHMVKDLPLTCIRFASAAELKEKFSTASTAPDMVLLKYYLPDERGAEVRSWLYEQDASLPVVLISSLNATHPGIATVHRLPSTLYLQKPFTASDLLNMIHLNLDDTLSG